MQGFSETEFMIRDKGFHNSNLTDQNCDTINRIDRSVQEIKEMVLNFMYNTPINMSDSSKLGSTANNPARSCMEIFDLDNNTPSGYFWLQSTNGSSIKIYCDMTITCNGVGGGWIQVAKLDMTNGSHQCPDGLTIRSDLLPKRVCGIPFQGAGCSSTILDVYNIEYNHVCGRILSYQYGAPDAFGTAIRTAATSPDDNYVDGISLTHGANPRKHIWTFAADLDQVGSYSYLNCPCTNTHISAAATVPSFVGGDYFCDTASSGAYQYTILYTEDPLWDGAGCGPNNVCCSLHNPPWFLKQLPYRTSDDIEVGMCRDQAVSNEESSMEMMEIYIQ